MKEAWEHPVAVRHRQHERMSLARKAVISAIREKGHLCLVPGPRRLAERGRPPRTRVRGRRRRASQMWGLIRKLKFANIVALVPILRRFSDCLPTR
jgi:hypothetical protein